MKSDGHVKGHMTGHLHRSIAYSLVTFAGLLAAILMLRAYSEAAALDETARQLEASVSSIPR